MSDESKTDRSLSTASRWAITVNLAAGWLCLLVATNLNLLASIQAGMVGLGFIGSAIVVAVVKKN